jgi:hypothetical protein
MGEFSTLLQQGNAWFFIPSAILLGCCTVWNQGIQDDDGGLYYCY